MKRKVYASLLVMGLACMAVTLLISTWFFWNSTQRQIQQELEMTMNVVETTIEEGNDTTLYCKRWAFTIMTACALPGSVPTASSSLNQIMIRASWKII